MAGLKPMRRTNSADDPAADFCEQLTRDTFLAAFLGGNVVSVEHDGTAATVDIAHGLQRAYQGAIQICGSSAQAITCISPETAQASGVDITRFVRIRQDSALAMTSRWRVF